MHDGLRMYAGLRDRRKKPDTRIGYLKRSCRQRSERISKLMKREELLWNCES